MNDTWILDRLREARRVLEASYVRDWQDDGMGGHCALGSVAVALGRAIIHYYEPDAAPFYRLLNSTARALHPERVAKNRHHEDPIVLINNETDKATTLAVFDAAILDLEIKLATEPVSEPTEPVMV